MKGKPQSHLEHKHESVFTRETALYHIFRLTKGFVTHSQSIFFPL